MQFVFWKGLYTYMKGYKKEYFVYLAHLATHLRGRMNCSKEKLRNNILTSDFFPFSTANHFKNMENSISKQGRSWKLQVWFRFPGGLPATVYKKISWSFTIPFQKQPAQAKRDQQDKNRDYTWSIPKERDDQSHLLIESLTIKITSISPAQLIKT